MASASSVLSCTRFAKRTAKVLCRRPSSVVDQQELRRFGYMRLILDALFIALAISTLIGWVYFWFLCVSRAERLLKPLFGSATAGLVCIGFPFAFFGLLYGLILAFGVDAASWLFVTFGLVLPALGIWSIKAGKWD